MPQTSDTNTLADFALNLTQRYQLVLAHLSDYATQKTATASTVANQQYYAYPLGVVNIESCYITIGSVKYPLDVVSSQDRWDIVNSFPMNPTTFPQFIFPRRDDFGIWPIPSSAYTITLNYHYRERDLSIADVTGTGGVTTNGATSFTDVAGIFLPNMAGLSLQITDTTDYGWGYWYRIASYNSTTSLTLENYWQSTSGTGLTYRIGQIPEIPEEGHVILVDGVTADFYTGLRNDPQTGTLWNNKFWTGDMNNPSRKLGDSNIRSGLIGLANQYTDRNKEVLIQRSPRIGNWQTRAWSYSVTA